MAAVGIGPNRLQAVLTHDATRSYGVWAGRVGVGGDMADVGGLAWEYALTKRVAMRFVAALLALTYVAITGQLAGEAADKGGCITFGFGPMGGTEYVPPGGKTCY